MGHFGREGVIADMHDGEAGVEEDEGQGVIDRQSELAEGRHDPLSMKVRPSGTAPKSSSARLRPSARMRSEMSPMSGSLTASQMRLRPTDQPA